MKDFIRNKVRESLITENRVKMDIPVPEDIKKIKDVFKKNGHKLYIVGGAVRDSLLNQPIKDYDLATDATPDKVEQMMQSAGLRTIPTGKAFGVINVFVGDEEFEIATFRRDSSTGDGRRPDSVEFTTIDQDVKRRDLTINALFFDIDTSEVVDLVGGIDDLKNGVVKTVGNPADRFGEDRLRIIRAIRFASRFGSELEPSVEKALKNDASLEGISPERIRDEFLKGIKTAKSVKHFLGLINKFGLFDWVFKGLDVDNDFIEDKDPMVVIATLLKGNHFTDLPKGLNKLKYSVDENKVITFLVSLLEFKVTDSNNIAGLGVILKKMMNKTNVTPDQLRNFGGRIGVMSQILNALEKFEFSVSGQSVQDETGLKPGIELGQEINRREIENFNQAL
jgi:tRNA nucleotidyltransferase/poly(A) polymerase